MSEAQRPAAVQADYPLARLSTVRTGGPAEFFARAGSEGELAELLAWAQAQGAPVSIVGSGSNLLIADAGVAGLVIKLDRELAGIEREGPRPVRGGGARPSRWRTPTRRRWPPRSPTCAPAVTPPSRRASGRSDRRSRTPTTRARRAAAPASCSPRPAARA